LNVYYPEEISVAGMFYVASLKLSFPQRSRSLIQTFAPLPTLRMQISPNIGS